MHFYWRVMEELKTLGEQWVITDPGLKRCYDFWMKKMQSGLEKSK